MISTRDLALLPDVDTLRSTLQSMAVLDAVLCPEWEFRYYSFNAVWAKNQQLASMRNGSGDDLLIHFGPAGCWLKGFAHEYPMTSYRVIPPQPWPGIYELLPAEFRDDLGDAAMDNAGVTFCIWRRPTDDRWQIGPIVFPANHPDPDGSQYLLSHLDGRPRSYLNWATDNYDREISLPAVERIYHQQPLTRQIVQELNPVRSLVELATELQEIGYPSSL